MTQPLLRMAGMSVELKAGDRTVDIIADTTLELNRGERLGVVGESGSGKSVTALAVMGLLPQSMRVRGQLTFDGRDLATMPEDEYCKFRGRRMAMIFQEPMTALNPVKTIGAQIAEGRILHLGETRAEAEKRARLLLDKVGLPAPRFNLGLYPHQLSGGQRQRVMIAAAIACEPDLLIADEPTTALDVTVQAQILDLLNELIDDAGMTLMLITHDLGVVFEMTNRIAVMYAGRVVETGRTDDVFSRMAHPYSRGLFAASPHGAGLMPRPQGMGRARLTAIPGVVPDPFARPPHCTFADRCAFVEPDCRESMPKLRVLEARDGVEHRAACLHPRTDLVRP